MVGRYGFHNGKRYQITQWDTPAGQVSTSPSEPGWVGLLRNVILANMSPLYYYNSDLYCIIHPNLPAPSTTATGQRVNP